LAAAAECTQAPITALRKKGLIESETRRVQQGQFEEPPVARDQRPALHQDQQQALKRKMRQYKNDKCGDPPPWAKAWAEHPAPTEEQYQGHKTPGEITDIGQGYLSRAITEPNQPGWWSRNWQYVAGAGAVVVLVGAVVPLARADVAAGAVEMNVRDARRLVARGARQAGEVGVHRFRAVITLRVRREVGQRGDRRVT